MAYMEVSRVEVTEVIRRWQAGGSQRHISAAIGMSRSTVRKYITAAVQAGLRQDGAPPTEEQLTSLVRMNVSGPRTVEIPTEDTLAPWADQVYQWLTAERLQITRIQELLSARGCQVSYTSLRRFLQRRSWRLQPGANGQACPERSRRAAESATGGHSHPGSVTPPWRIAPSRPRRGKLGGNSFITTRPGTLTPTQRRRAMLNRHPNLPDRAIRPYSSAAC